MALTILNPFPGFKFGCDPELFVLNREGIAVTAEGLLPGTKEAPYKVMQGAVQVDGMAAEFNIDPAETFEEFNDNIESVLAQLKKMLPKGYKLSCVPAVEFSEEEWAKAPENAKVLGCNPDFNAWTGSPNESPDTTSRPRLRTASGHLHIGWTEGEDMNEEHLRNCTDLVKQLDWYLGGWSLLQDEDKTRRLLYGKAGACRFKPYGVEYRVLSNFWIPTMTKRLHVWNRMQRALTNMRTVYMPDKAKTQNFRLVDCIDNSHVDTNLFHAYSNPLIRI